MYRTVSDILKLRGFERTSLVAGEQGLSNLVASATLMEVPDIFPYLEENTLLLTTLYPLSGDQQRLSEFIPQLYDRGVCGIGIKPMRYITEIPDIMIEQANQLGFPIIKLPQDANLSTMANHILSLSLNDNIAKLQFRDKMHRILTQLLLDGAGIENLAEHLSCMIKKDIVLLDKNFYAVCIASFIPGDNASAAVYTGAKADEMLKSKGEWADQCVMYPIKAGKTVFGYILVSDIPESAEDEEDLKLALEQSAMLFATLFFKDDAVKQNQRNFRDVFIRDLLQGKIRSDIEIDNKMNAFGLSIQFPQHVICLCLFTDNEQLKKKVYNDIINNKFIQKQVASFTEVNPKDMNVIYFNDALVILMDGEDGKHTQEIFCYVLDKLIKQHHSSAKIGIGISNRAGGFHMLDTAYRQAVSALKTGGILYDESFVSHYRDNRLFELIAQIPNHKVLKQFVLDKLGPLIDFDAEEGSNLMVTLQNLIQEDFNYKKAAESSYMHYNTIRYRINKIKQLGVSLEGGQNLCELILAYNGYVWLKSTNEI